MRASLRTCWTITLGVGALMVGVARAPRAGGDEKPRREAKPSARADSVRDFQLKDLDGVAHRLSDHRGAKAIVLAWTAPGCPVAMVYAPRLAAAAKAWAERGVAFLGVASDADESVEETRALVRGAGIAFPVLLDADGALAQRVGAKTTTTVAVLDANWRVRYLGALDDQYGVGGRKEKAEHRWLEDALEAVLAAKAVAVERTAAPGCPITFRAPAVAGTPDPAAPTWSRDVAKVVYARCTGCHTANEAAPFVLRSYEDVRSRVATLRAAVSEDRMPPWHAAGDRGTWQNDRRLLPEEKARLLAWLDAGAPEGDPKAAPAPPAVPGKDAWEMGAPDAVLSFRAPEAVPAEGVVPYRYVRVPTDFAEDRWVRAVEVKPGAPGVVHHVLVAAVPADAKRVSGAFEPTQGFFAAMVPGGRVQRFPDGMAKRLPKGYTLVFQMHYTPNGVAAEDTTRIGLRFGEKPDREVHTAGVYNPTFRIPPGAAAWEVRAALPVPWNSRILAFMPHMHLRGASFKYLVWKSGEGDKVVFEVPRYDFNWQTPVRCVTPIPVAKGSILKAVATFDNSEGNPYNPDPKAEVRWGDQTWEEMMIGYVDYVIDP